MHVSADITHIIRLLAHKFNRKITFSLKEASADSVTLVYLLMAFDQDDSKPK